jgi:hypothetical protein
MIQAVPIYKTPNENLTSLFPNPVKQFFLLRGGMNQSLAF